MALTRALSNLVVVPDSEVRPPSVSDIIDRVLTDKTRRFKFFRPSMIHGCDRQNVFHYMNAPSKPSQLPLRMMRILDNGTAVHDVIQGYLQDHPDWWFARESRVSAEVEGAAIRGSCDGVLIRRSDGYRLGIEIKTINSSDWSTLTSPKKEHVLQSALYAHLQRLSWMSVLYWNKDNQNIKEFHVKQTSDTFDVVRKRIVHLRQYIDRKELPPYNPKTCNLMFCTFVDYCRKKGAPV